MRSRWSEEEAAGFVARYGAKWGEPLALRTYSARLLGAEPALVLRGGGNSSVKAPWKNIFGESRPAVFVKASGADMAALEPDGHPGLDLDCLLRLRDLSELDDKAMVEQLRTNLLRPDGATPSIEALVHAFLPATFIDHTHADAILALTNRPDGESVARRALGADVIVLPYVTPGFKLALAAAAALEAQPQAEGMVWAHHGVVAWRSSAQGSYETMIDLVSRAERFLETRRSRVVPSSQAASRPAGAAGPAAVATEAVPAEAPAAEAADIASAVVAPSDLLAAVAPVVRGLLAARTDDCDRPYRRVVVQPLTSPGVMAALAASGAREALVTPPLTTDHLIRTKALPLWVEGLSHGDPARLHEQLESAVGDYCEAYDAYLDRHATDMPPGVEPFDSRPRVVLIPGLGALCAGPDLRESTIVRDITEHSLAVKSLVAETPTVGGPYQGLPEDELFRMEYRTLQHAKLGRTAPANAASSRGLVGGAAAPSRDAALRGHIALITGAAGAIGTGICRGLLEAGCLVAATDLPGAPLDTLVRTMEADFGESVLGVPMDVTDAASVAAGFAQVARTWGGVDLVIANAGVAMAGPLDELDLGRYRKLEQVNVEGTLLVLAEAARLFKRQRTGGDIVLVSTKNVFAPGANFGAYSSTKAAAHQLARIASLELAGDDVRVNMVSPDAVFACGSCRSGLWAEVGPDRMKARGLDEAGLEAYYQSRNLLKAQVTAAHVANAVLFFATRQTPTTGATIPVDGGLPDSTPR
jgi:rhamnose utilization protein RhaD (predicted bifunctional aldolase and dehydrogenase)/NAD(P)-dependent dehydrogenase (short-subunit alcohol dehydrogenase family)